MIPIVYELTQDIINPKPNRRNKHDWRFWPVIPKGTKFRMTEASDTVRNSRSLAEFRSADRLWENDPQDAQLFHLVLHSLVHSEVGLPELLWDSDCEKLLRQLVEQGKVSLDVLRQLRYETEED